MCGVGVGGVDIKWNGPTVGCEKVSVTKLNILYSKQFKWGRCFLLAQRQYFNEIVQKHLGETF